MNFIGYILSLLSNDINLDYPKLKAFSDYELNETQHSKFVMG